ncbi:unnamed protein product [Calypogeia fissa]
MVAEKLPEAPKLSVTIEKVEKVLPLTPREDHVYYLTNLDQNTCMVVKTVSLFHAKGEVTADPVKVIKESLVNVLDLYYPLAGRLGISVDGKLQVNYNSQGVVFVEASSESSIDDLGDISKPDERLHELIYTSPDATNIFEAPLVAVQVTKFKCGGFAFGLANQHSMFDGIGAIEFNRSWSEIAKGLPVSNPPFLDRTILKARSPPLIGYPHDEFAEIEDLSKDGHLVINEIVHDSFCFTPAEMDVLKKKVLIEGDIQSCTTFEVLSGIVWKARTMALKMEPEQKTRLYFAVDGRSKFSPALPAGYMGNGIVLTYAMTTSADLCGKPFHHAVKLVQNAIALINDSYMRSAIDYFEETHARPATTGSMIITTWSKLPFQTTDFGWGEPSQAGPVVLPEKEIVLFLAHGKERKSINVLLGLPPKVMEEFRKVLKEA